jgi:hypothetical protein
MKKVYSVEIVYDYSENFKAGGNLGSYRGLEDFTQNSVENAIKNAYEWYDKADKEKYTKFLSLHTSYKNNPAFWHYPSDYDIFVVGVFRVHETVEIEVESLTDLEKYIERNFKNYEIRNIEPLEKEV